MRGVVAVEDFSGGSGRRTVAVGTLIGAVKGGAGLARAAPPTGGGGGGVWPRGAVFAAVELVGGADSTGRGRPIVARRTGGEVPSLIAPGGSTDLDTSIVGPDAVVPGRRSMDVGGLGGDPEGNSRRM